MSRFRTQRVQQLDHATAQQMGSPAVWHSIIAQIENQLDEMLRRAEAWNAEFHDKLSKRDIVELRVLLVRMEAFSMADSTTQLACRRLDHMRHNVQRFYDNDERVYQDRTARLQRVRDGFFGYVLMQQHLAAGVDSNSAA